MNPLYNSLNNMQGFMAQFNQFKKTFSGDPKQQVQQLLNSGKINQAQYDNAVKMADQLFKMMNT